MAPTLEQLTLADSSEHWQRCGFAVEEDSCVVGSIGLRFVTAGSGLVGWGLSGQVDEIALDGLPPSSSDRSPLDPAPPHPNGVTGLDHVVVITPDLDRTVAVLVGAGLDLRRVREEPTPAGAPRQAFFRLGEPILEVVQAPPEAIERSGGPDGPAFFWGIALIAPDLEATVAAIGPELVSGPRDAVQPGRRIATLRRDAGLALPVALISPPGRSA